MRASGYMTSENLICDDFKDACLEVEALLLNPAPSPACLQPLLAFLGHDVHINELIAALVVAYAAGGEPSLLAKFLRFVARPYGLDDQGLLVNEAVDILRNVVELLFPLQRCCENERDLHWSPSSRARSCGTWSMKPSENAQ